MQLTDEGKLKIDGLFSEYYPDYPNSENITLRQLLDMTSGIPDWYR
ncbi:MAG: serine hydrolase [Ignavibacteria bacterium]|nr:serine hydrolase [Ignavibacteria bacterium]